MTGEQDVNSDSWQELPITGAVIISNTDARTTIMYCVSSSAPGGDVKGVPVRPLTEQTPNIRASENFYAKAVGRHAILAWSE